MSRALTILAVLTVLNVLTVLAVLTIWPSGEPCTRLQRQVVGGIRWIRSLALCKTGSSQHYPLVRRGRGRLR